MDDLAQASGLLRGFKGESLPGTVAKIEQAFRGTTKSSVLPLLERTSITADLFTAALLIKKNASQIDEVVHTLGILLALPSILEGDEEVESLSLAAGNTGKGFDLETTRRIAEFTFIQWQGGPEVIRQNKVFKDFYFLAEAETDKIRELYVVGTQHAERFFISGRALPRILNGNAKLGDHFKSRYGTRFKVVRDYYETKKDAVAIRDIRPHLASFKAL